jgi:hypothetical protein
VKNNSELHHLKEAIRLAIDEIILEKKSNKKPGGPLTPLGALHVLRKSEFLKKVNDALHNAEGDEEDAADKLGVSKSLVRHYEDKYPQLAAAQKREEDKAEKDQKDK